MKKIYLYALRSIKTRIRLNINRIILFPKYGALAALFLLVFIEMSAQDKPSWYWGPLLDDRKGEELISIFGSSDECFFTIHTNRRRKSEFLISKIETDSLTSTAEEVVSFPIIKGLEPLLAYPLSLKEKTYLLATADDPESENVYIFAFELLENLALSPSPITLGVGNRAALINENGFRTYRSDSLNLVALLIPEEAMVGKNEKFSLRLFDDNLNLLQSKELEVPHAAGDFEYYDVLIDSTEYFYLLAAIKDKNLTLKDSERNIGKNYSLIKYKWDTESLVEKSLSLGSKWLYDVHILRNSNGNVQVAGYYSNMVDLIMAGTFSLELEQATGKIISQGITPFDREFRSQFRPSGGNITETELGKFDLDYVYPLADNKLQLISEKNYMRTTTVFNPATGTYSVINVYNFDEIMVSVIKPNSEILYNLMIPKYQSSSRSETAFASYIAFSGNQNTYLVYNDHEKNADVPLEDFNGHRQINSANNTEAILVSIGPNGETKKTSLFSTSAERTVFDPNFYYRTSKSVILMTSSGYKTKFLKLNLD